MSAPPPGPPCAAIRTLLLCDLVARTQLVERLGDAAAADLIACHDRLARDPLAAHGGREIDKSDGFLLLFERPIEALRFALAYQARLREHGVGASAALGRTSGRFELVLACRTDPSRRSNACHPIAGSCGCVKARAEGCQRAGDRRVRCVQALRQHVQMEVAVQPERDRKRYRSHAAVLVKLVLGVRGHALEDAKRSLVAPPTDQHFA